MAQDTADSVIKNSEFNPMDNRYNVRILKKREKRRTTYATFVDSSVQEVLLKVREVLEREDFRDGLVEVERIEIGRNAA